MSQYWDPTNILQLRNDKRCVGYAPSKRRKCLNPILADNFNKCKTLLMELAGQRPDPDILESKLISLAEHALCVRNHQSQVDSMVRKWSGMMRTAYPPMPRGWIPVEPRTQVSSSLSSSLRTPSVMRSRQPNQTVTSLDTPLPDPRDDQAFQDALAAMQEIIHMHQRPVVTTRYASSATIARPELSRLSVPTTSMVHPPRASTADTGITSSRPATPTPPSLPAANTVPTTRQVSSSPTTTLQSSSPTTAPQTPSRSTTPSPQPSPPPSNCAIAHVRRLPLDEECSVCYDDIPLSECDPSQLVWCRSGCGRSVHLSCFDDWREQRQDTPLTCMICRSAWASDCDCNSGCTAAHVRRKGVVDKCSICQEHLRPPEEVGRVPPVPPMLSWCKNGCGRNVHGECFESWREECVKRGKAATCTDCRTVWEDGCEC